MHHRKRGANFYAHFLREILYFFPCCPPWTHDLIHVSDKKIFFTYHQAPFPLCSLLHQCVSVFCGPPFQRVALRRLVSLYIFSPLHSQPLCLFLSLFLTLSFYLFLILSLSLFLRLIVSLSPFFTKEGARNEYTGETAREIAPFLQHSSTLLTPWKYERGIDRPLAVRTFTPALTSIYIHENCQ